MVETEKTTVMTPYEAVVDKDREFSFLLSQLEDALEREDEYYADGLEDELNHSVCPDLLNLINDGIDSCNANNDNVKIAELLRIRKRVLSYMLEETVICEDEAIELGWVGEVE